MGCKVRGNLSEHVFLFDLVLAVTKAVDCNCASTVHSLIPGANSAVVRVVVNMGS